MKNLLTPMISFIKKKSTVLLTVFVLLVSNDAMFAQKYKDVYPNSLIWSSGPVTLCEGSSPTLTVTFSTAGCTTGVTGAITTTYDPITVNWYDNGATNSEVGGTLVSTSSGIASTTSWSYTPTPPVGMHYYYCVISWSNGNPLAICDAGNAIGIEPPKAQLITIDAAPTASAGTPISTCSSAGAVNITAGASASNQSSITWTAIGGDGTFTSRNSITLCKYTPGPNDIMTGNVTLQLAANSSICTPATSTKILTILSNNTTDTTGVNDTTCAGNGAVNITAGANAVNASSIVWASSGSGVFTNPASLTLCTYTPSPTDISNGFVTLTLTATGSSCGTAVSKKKLVINAVATATAGGTVLTCSSAGAVNICYGAAATHYSSVTWSGGNGGTFNNQNSLTNCTYTPSAADILTGSATITLTVYGNSPCGNATSTKTLTIYKAPTAVAGPSFSTCSNSGTVNITAGSSATNYTNVTWSGGNGGTYTHTNSLTSCTYTPSGADISTGSVTFTLTVTGSGYCSTTTDTKVLTINALPTAVAGAPVNSCGAAAVNITAGSSATNESSVTWSGGVDGSFTNPNSLTTCTYTPGPTDISNGTVTLILTAFGLAPCGNAIDTKVLTIGTMTISTSTTSNILCNGGTGSLTATPSGGVVPYTYAWSDLSSQSNATASGLSAGTYTVTVQDNSGGCSVTASATITQPYALSDNISNSQNETCLLGYATVTVNGGTGPYNYSWAPSGQTTATASGLSAGTYTLTVTDANGCAASPSPTLTTIIRYYPLIDSISGLTEILCSGSNTGTATVGVRGGQSPYTYSWSNSTTARRAVSLSAGSYSVTVTDLNGCTTTASVTITQPTVLNASIGSQTNVTCYGQSDGSVSISESGGVAPYTYLWTPNISSTSSASGLSAGSYLCRVYDNNGCSIVVSIRITQPVNLTATITEAGCNLSVNTAGGTSPYTYAWAPGGQTSSSVTVTDGTYTVTVNDANGCSATASHTASGCPSALPSEDKKGPINSNSNLVNTTDITVYPNPSNGQFTVAGLETGMIVEMYDYTGRKISTVSAGNNSIQLNISGQADGIYLIRILSKDGVLVDQKKLMKTN